MALNKNNADYLLHSGLFEKGDLDEDPEVDYNKLLAKNDTDEFFKKLIINFLLPYRISVFKFMFNKEYYNTPEVAQFAMNKKPIAPSLLLLVENPMVRSLGYPNWFYIVFPDVAWWALQGEGNPIVKEVFGNLPIGEVVEGDKLKYSFLQQIINLYIKQTNNMLECQVF